MTLLPVRRGPAIDDLLGPAEGRFFGSGYRTAVRELAELQVDGSGVRGVAGIAHPAGWSRKADGEQRPHLSTVDAIVLTGQLVETHLALVGGLSPVEVADSWLRRLRIRAGTRPLDGPALAAFPIAVTAGVEPPEPAGRRRVAVLECRVGPMSVRAEVDHPEAAGRAPVRGAEGRLPPGSGHHHLIDDVAVDAAGLAAEARVRMSPDGLPGPVLESRHAPAVTMVDAFVVTLQLGQAMLYRLDDLRRDHSATLWMRTAEITASTPARPAPDIAVVRARLHEPQLLRPARSGRWRRATVESLVGALGVRCSVAHDLPGESG